MTNVNPQKLLLYSCGDTCKEFFNNIQPCNLYLEANKKYRTQIEKYLKKLCQYNVVCDGMVEKFPCEGDVTNEPPVLRLVDCKMGGFWVETIGKIALKIKIN